MKKLLIIFCCMFGLLPVSGFALNGIETQCINGSSRYAHTTDNDYFCYSYMTTQSNGAPYINYHCFQADTGVCPTGTIVCILGTETKLWSGSSLVGKRRCAVAYATNKGGDDTWLKYDPYEFDDCENTKWAKNDGIGKNNEAMIINDKPVISKNGYPMQYWVKYSNEDIANLRYPNICVGYYCKGSDGKYAEPCDDGTCGSCPKTKSTIVAAKPTTNKQNSITTNSNNTTVDSTPPATTAERAANAQRINQILEKLK